MTVVGPVLIGADPVRMMDASVPIFWVALVAIQVISLIGYAASSLPAWAKWSDGTQHDRLTILRGTIASLLSSNIAFGVGYYYYYLPDIICWVAVAIGGYAGDAFLSPLIGKFVTLLQPKGT